ncbi:MAG: winged helix-turn-helix domain-containing protein [Candidatus Heimdallarchaeota archaeon]
MSKKLESPRFKYSFNVVRQFSEQDSVEDLRWICHALSLVNPRDRSETVVSVVQTILTSTREGKGLPSEKIAERVGITRGTVVHHIKRLIRAGLVVQKGHHYELREFSLERTIERIKEDVCRFIDDIMGIGKSIDKSYRLKSRK